MESPPRRARGRPRTEDLARLENDVLDVAIRLFFDNGYGATTMSAIAQTARVSKTTLYKRFPSKAALIRAITARQIESWSVGVHHIPVEDATTLEAMLIAYGQTLLRASIDSDIVRFQRLVQAESSRFPELADAAADRAGRGIDYIAGQIRRFAMADGIACRDPETAAELFLFALMGWSGVRTPAGSVAADRERLVKLVRAFLVGRDGW